MTRGAILALSVLSVAMFDVGGCNEPIPNELSYRCDLSGTAIDVNRDLATRLADQLAAEEKLQVEGHTPITGTSFDANYIVELRSSLSENISVSILCNEPQKIVAVTIRGNVRDPEASAIGQKAAEVFSRICPGSTLAPFVAREGIMGP
jgi:hypothetical protein